MRETLVLIVAGIACLVAESQGWALGIYVAKPLATLALLAFAWHQPPARPSRYRHLVALGLIASLAGDVLLMLPSDRFLFGLGAFLVAHLCYIAAFAGDGGGWRGPGVGLLLGAALLVVLGVIGPSLGALRVPVLLYMLVIGTMAWQAVVRWRRLGGTAARWAAIGAVLFLLSDTALAVRRFVGPYPLSPLLVLGTYWAAQWGIARSVGADTPVQRAR